MTEKLSARLRALYGSAQAVPDSLLGELAQAAERLEQDLELTGLRAASAEAIAFGRPLPGLPESSQNKFYKVWKGTRDESNEDGYRNFVPPRRPGPTSS
jgi:hypothetical protein